MSYKYHTLSSNFVAQYLGDADNELHTYMNLRRKGKSGCPHITEHIHFCSKNKSYSIQITKAFSDSIHDENGIMDKNIRGNIKDKCFVWT